MVELRKRPAPATAPAPAAKRSASKPRTSKAKQVVEKTKELVKGESASTAGTIATKPDTEPTDETPEIAAEQDAPGPAAAAAAAPAASSEEATTPLSTTSVGKTLPAAALAVEISTHDAQPASLTSILASSKSGVVIFTYPKASTPGCTTQACLFRDNYAPITAKGYDVYGLSNDSEKANTNFKTKQNLQYTMLCDPDAKVTGFLGLKKPGNAKGTLRGVVVLSKDGKVEVWFQGGPKPTVDTVMEFVGGM